MKSWLSPPSLEIEKERQISLLRRLLKTMFGIALLAQVLSFLDETNDWRINLGFYGAIYVWLGVAWMLVRRRKVATAAWSMGFFYWLIIAVVTLLFGGMQGQNASVFAVTVLLVGSIIGGRAALVMAMLSFGWGGVIVYLESNGLLPQPLTPYSPFNAWAAVNTTVLFTSILLHETLSSLKRMHDRAEKTARERDEALRRSIQGQKMELVGNLTSGIAHDFNNLLSVVTSASSSLRGSLSIAHPEDEQALDDLDEAASRAILITRQLLSLGRSMVGEAETLDLSDVLMSLKKMLPRLLGPAIHVEVQAAPEAWVHAPRVGLEQIILNLAVNARDAMPSGGTFRADVKLTDGSVTLLVSDTGVGMSDADKQRIFEPFFSTKSNGTGLGLSTVKQQVENASGTIEVDTAPSRGATFRITFPRTESPEAEARASLSQVVSRRPRTSGRVVLVEDEPLVRRATGRVLRSGGYEVLAFADGEEALAWCKASQEISCVVTDLVMPRMDGETLARHLESVRPGVPLIMMSGNREPAPELMQRSSSRYLTKPVSARHLLDAVGELTNQPLPSSELAREI
ncbi:MAG TPA: ATP-binding protein [Polyangiaceae bacterium]